MDIDTSPELLPDSDPTLWPGQQEACDALRAAHDHDVEKGYVDMATGTGKTRVAAEDINELLKVKPDARVLYLCHKREILEQAHRTFSEVLGTDSHGYVFGGEFQDQEQIVYATFQTMSRRLGGGRVYEAYDPEEFDYIVVDESHHGPAPTYRPVIEYFKPSFLLGLTATPERRDLQHTREIFGPEIYRLSLEEAIAKGYLAKPDYRVLTDHVRRLQEIETDIGKVTLQQLNRLVFVPKRDEEIVSNIKEHLAERTDPRTIVFCPTIEYAEHMATLFPDEAAALHSKLPDKIRRQRLEDFRNGKLRTIVAVDVFNEGVDIPEANVLVFLRSTTSKTIFLQQLGRGLRNIPGKEDVLVLDFVARWERIQMLQELKADIENIHATLPPAIRTGTPFRFDFSEELMDAIEVIETARGKRKGPTRSRIGRGRSRITHDQLRDLLSVEHLPNQEVSPRETHQYSVRILAGDSAAIEEYALRRVRAVYQIARNFPEEHGMTTEDYFQVGMAALMTGWGSYDPAKKSLATHAGGLAGHAMRMASRKRHPIHVPGFQQDRIALLGRLRTKLTQELGREPTPEELAGASKEKALDPMDVVEADLAAQSMSFETPDRALEVPDAIADSQAETILMRGQDREFLHGVFSYLGSTQRRVLSLRYGLDGQPRTLEEVARMLEPPVTRERVRQIENQALKELQGLPLSAEFGGEIRSLWPVSERRSSQEQTDSHTRGQFYDQMVEVADSATDIDWVEQINNHLGRFKAGLAVSIMRHLGRSTHLFPVELEDRICKGRNHQSKLKPGELVIALLCLKKLGLIRMEGYPNRIISLPDHSD